MRTELANYISTILPEHKGNPLIEALPPKVNDQQLALKLGKYPTCSSKERKLNAFERVEYLTRLKDLRQPLPIYLESFRAIEFAIKEGYSTRNPLSPTTQNHLHYTLANRPPIMPDTGFFVPKGSGITVIGESGVGKTSMLEQVLNYFPDVIDHEVYDETTLNFRQVVWLKVDCPFDSSVKALCYKILSELDKKLGDLPTKPNTTIPALLEQITKRINSSFLGILVIDEMQNINLAKAGGGDKLIRFIHSLINELGIPILFCANPPFNELLATTLKSARRAENNGYFDMDLMENDAVWQLFSESLWELQWTDKPTPYSQELSDKLLTLSVGNIDLAVRIFREAQRCIIGSGDERISIKVLEYAASNTIKSSAEIVNNLRRNRARDISSLRQASTKKPDQATTQSNPPNQKTIVEVNSSLQTIPGDLSRPQHSEFADRLLALQDATSLDPLIEDYDLLQRAAKSDNPESVLEQDNILCRSPLDEF